jgi:hypothetical protein
MAVCRGFVGEIYWSSKAGLSLILVEDVVLLLILERDSELKRHQEAAMEILPIDTPWISFFLLITLILPLDTPGISLFLLITLCT